MEKQNFTRKKFWQKRALKEGLTYGTQPSLTAQLALPYIAKGQSVLTVGDAYGRNALLLAKQGAKVVNIDLSKKWIQDADRLKKTLQITNIHGDILAVKFPPRSFNVIFANFVLHFFTDQELNSLFVKLNQWLREQGLFICSWLSNKDQYAHEGYPNGQYIKCYARKELRKLYGKNHFRLTTIIPLFEIETIFNTKRKTHFWFTIAKPEVK